ncbi:hypothetical protein LX32DRAFT_190441 [Colletotrichum zoysiae]|uniref:Uncharacterized protein n=1 Tax=Colletotrichum zoysiae TaxID=1216348 RepID=A0AAD9LYB1_9PEZI|nr:hypothetical protein LX32DRAFT_190441 [Colletotrichum zoysiae]
MFRLFFFGKGPSRSHARKEPPILAPAFPACSELDQSRWRDRASTSIPPLSLYGRGWPACRAKLRYDLGGARATVSLKLLGETRRPGKRHTSLFLLLLPVLRPPIDPRDWRPIPALFAARLTRSDERGVTTKQEFRLVPCLRALYWGKRGAPTK